MALDDDAPQALQRFAPADDPLSSPLPERDVLASRDGLFRSPLRCASGKDHWPIGSYVVMEKGRCWANRVVGETDGPHFAQLINPTTPVRDDANNRAIIYPKHVHKALRRYLGVEGSPGAQRFPFNDTEDFAFFG